MTPTNHDAERTLELLVQRRKKFESILAKKIINSDELATLLEAPKNMVAGTYRPGDDVNVTVGSDKYKFSVLDTKPNKLYENLSISGEGKIFDHEEIYSLLHRTEKHLLDYAKVGDIIEVPRYVEAIEVFDKYQKIKETQYFKLE